MEGGRRKRRGPPVLSSLAAPSSPSETSSIGSSLDFLLPSTSVRTSGSVSIHTTCGSRKSDYFMKDVHFKIRLTLFEGRRKALLKIEEGQE